LTVFCGALLFSLIFFGLFQGVLNHTVKAATVTPTDVEFDYKCEGLLFSPEYKDSSGNPICNRYCSHALIFDGEARNNKLCKFGSVDEVFVSTALLPKFFIPQEDAALIYIRAGLMAILGGGGLLVVLYGLYGWYVRSMSGGNPEKVALSMSIYKNAILGVIIIFSSFVIVQMLFVFLGIMQSPLDVSFIPKIGYIVDVKENDIGRKCYSLQSDANGIYKCVDNLWSK
jgi:hypothetical protein